jgi:hypothetical protein
MLKITRTLIFVLYFVTAATQLGCQASPPSVFEVPNLGFRYTPPANMIDTTAQAKANVERKAAARGTSNVITVLLSLNSKGPDTAPDWRSIAIETYPREKIHAQSDRDASESFARNIAGGGKQVGATGDVTYGPFHFVVADFQLQDGQTLKHARIYTAVRNDRMLAFAFSSNSTDALYDIDASMKTFEPLAIK